MPVDSLTLDDFKNVELKEGDWGVFFTKAGDMLIVGDDNVQFSIEELYEGTQSPHIAVVLTTALFLVDPRAATCRQLLADVVTSMMSSLSSRPN